VDFVIDIQALSSLYSAGCRPTTSPRPDISAPLTANAVGKLARMFRTDPEPHNSFGF
jgi:hypothetical protein